MEVRVKLENCNKKAREIRVCAALAICREELSDVRRKVVTC